MVPGEAGLEESEITCGVPQRSVLELTLWNMFYNGLLKFQQPEGAVLVEFADDVGLLMTNHTMEGIKTATNTALQKVDAWIRQHGLKQTHAKSEAVMLNAKWAYRQPVIYSGVQIPIRRVVKYLGMTLDAVLTFTRHVRAVVESTRTSAKAVGRLMPNVGGPSAVKRRLLSTVVISRLLYATPVWDHGPPDSERIETY